MNLPPHYIVKQMFLCQLYSVIMLNIDQKLVAYDLLNVSKLHGVFDIVTKDAFGCALPEQYICKKWQRTKYTDTNVQTGVNV